MANWVRKEDGFHVLRLEHSGETLSPDDILQAIGKIGFPIGVTDEDEMTYGPAERVSDTEWEAKMEFSFR